MARKPNKPVVVPVSSLRPDPIKLSATVVTPAAEKVTKLPAGLKKSIAELTDTHYPSKTHHILVKGPVVSKALKNIANTVRSRQEKINAFLERHGARLINDPHQDTYRRRPLALVKTTRAKNTPGWKRVDPSTVKLDRSSAQGKAIVADWDSTVPPITSVGAAAQRLLEEWLHPDTRAACISVTVAADLSCLVLRATCRDYDPGDVENYLIARRVYGIAPIPRVEVFYSADVLRGEFPDVEPSRVKGVVVAPIEAYTAVKLLQRIKDKVPVQQSRLTRRHSDEDCVAGI